MTRDSMEHRFVEFIPAKLNEGIVYVSIEYGTASHLCCCGCGEKVVTPITPTDWSITFNGDAVSLYPSIGNWRFKCRSHYWIKKDQVEWADDMLGEQINQIRMVDKRNKASYFNNKKNVGNKSILSILKEWFK